MWLRRSMWLRLSKPLQICGCSRVRNGPSRSRNSHPRHKSDKARSHTGAPACTGLHRGSLHPGRFPAACTGTDQYANARPRHVHQEGQWRQARRADYPVKTFFSLGKLLPYYTRLDNPPRVVHARKELCRSRTSRSPQVQWSFGKDPNFPNKLQNGH